MPIPKLPAKPAGRVMTAQRAAEGGALGAEIGHQVPRGRLANLVGCGRQCAWARQSKNTLPCSRNSKPAGRVMTAQRGAEGGALGAEIWTSSPPGTVSKSGRVRKAVRLGTSIKKAHCLVVATQSPQGVS